MQAYRFQWYWTYNHKITLACIPEQLKQQMQQTHMNFELHMTPTITE